MTEFRRVPARRRAILGAGLAVAAGGIGAAGLASQAAAQQKLAKNLIMYQETPKGDQRCDNCTHWQPPNACAIVEGHILPQAWCGAWAPKT